MAPSVFLDPSMTHLLELSLRVFAVWVILQGLAKVALGQIMICMQSPTKRPPSKLIPKQMCSNQQA